MLKLNLISKKCGTCTKVKSLRRFRERYNTGAINKNCKSCCEKATKKWLEQNERSGGMYYTLHKERQRKLREEVIAHYGGKCACCGEDRFEFLAIDHEHGNGNKHRRSIGLSRGGGMCDWLKKNGFPSGFRILCHSCNNAFGFYGHCPHQTENYSAMYGGC